MTLQDAIKALEEYKDTNLKFPTTKYYEGFTKAIQILKEKNDATD